MLKKIKTVFKDMDKVLFFSTLILIVFGTLNIVTASSREAVVNADTNIFYYFYKHSIILIISFLFFLFILSIKTKEYKNWLVFLYIGIFILNIYLVLKGAATRGANNWIDLKLLKVQPSELSKPILVITMALLFDKYNKKLNNPKIKHGNIIWQIIGFGLIIPIIVFFQKDLGTATILFGIFFIMFIFSPINIKEQFKSMMIVGVIGIISLFSMYSFTGKVLSEAQLSRMDFFDPCSKYAKSGYQICNAFIAINNGGLTGVGIGKSTQKYSYIPEPHTDMVFSIIAEENGVIICAGIFILYLIILYRILKLSTKTKKLRNKYICIGIASYIFLHILINLGGLFGLMPLTGVPLPFLSYGGSFTISLISSLAVIQRIYIEMKNEKIKI